ncbi:MAG TPA: GatB/YqeY domain-containing protein [Tepidiformaceae bacterium]|nr:GatB/YqeY domain-containing protein [Tepidiformaceae bacterium]
MATLKDQVQADLADAMRNREETRKAALRMLIAAIKNTEIEQGKPLDDAAVTAVIQKQVKQRRESIIEFEKGNRPDLVEREAAESAILETYLPEQARPEEIEAAARRVIAETGASGPRDLGKVMPALTREFAGRADGRAISEIVRSLLGA